VAAESGGYRRPRNAGGAPRPCLALWCPAAPRRSGVLLPSSVAAFPCPISRRHLAPALAYPRPLRSLPHHHLLLPSATSSSSQAPGVLLEPRGAIEVKGKGQVRAAVGGRRRAGGSTLVVVVDRWWWWGGFQWRWARECLRDRDRGERPVAAAGRGPGDVFGSCLSPWVCGR
jgi:hypothetical protein